MTRQPNANLWLQIFYSAAFGIPVLLAVGCNQSSQQEAIMPTPSKPSDSPSPNSKILDETNAANLWFHARKTRPIWAKELTESQTVRTLEGEEQVSVGDFLCRGEAGDTWPQTHATLNGRYSATEEVDEHGWQKYQPRPDAQGVMAAQINHSFQVVASWGTLKGKAGDYLVKPFEDRDAEQPADVWIVDQTLFSQTYQQVSTP